MPINKNSCRRCGSNVHATAVCPNTAAARAADEKVRAVAAAAAEKTAAATAKRVAARVAALARRNAAQQRQAFHVAVHAALAAVAPVPATVGIDRNSSWACVNDLCLALAGFRLEGACAFRADAQLFHSFTRILYIYSNK